MGSPPGVDRSCFRFGVFELNPTSGELRKHGIRVRLQEQPLKLLLYLLEAPGEICTREALIKRMWPDGTFVDYDRGLNSAATRLRQVIGDSADAPLYIETVGRKGYRFIAPVERTASADTGSPAREPAGRQPAPLTSAARLVPQEPVQQHKPRRAGEYLIVLAIGLAAGVAIDWWRASPPGMEPLVRLSVDLEPGMTPAGAGTALALAPDGTRLALAVRCDDGRIRLATRRLDQSHLTPLPGTEGATSPFFSPDGKWIAFFADERLKKVAVQGGLPVTLANASTFARGPRARFPAGSWGDDGNIIAMLNPGAGLVRIPSAGGPPMPLRGLKKGDDEIDTWPQVLPAQAVLFTRNKGDYDSANLEIFSFKTGEQKTVLKGGFFGRYLPGGYLAYLHRNTLFAVSFDLSRLAVVGTPRPVLEDVNSRLADWSFDFAKTGRFAYLNHDVEPRQSIFWMDHAGRTSPLPAPGESSTASPRFSADGRRLAFSRSTRGQQDIWVLDLNRNAASRLTALPGVNDSPVWTPDGLNIMFRSIDQPKPGIYGVRTDGSGDAHRLLELTNGELPSSMSPDGTRLAMWAGGKIWLAPVQTVGADVSIGTPVQFLQTRFSPAVPGRMAPAISPDGRWLAYCANESEQLDVYVVPFLRPGGKWRISTNGGMFPAWSRKGRELFFQDLESHAIMAATYKTSGDSFVAESPRVWSDTRILDLGVHQTYDVAPDGRSLAVVLYVGGTAEWKRIPKVAFLLNFFDELRRRVSTDGN